jgi:hypothetical protein
MRFTSQERVEEIVERRFRLGEIPGVLWTPVSASVDEPVSLILAGQPGGPAGLDRTHPRLLARAQRAAQAGFGTATLELPGSGDRPMPAGVDQARIEMRAALTAGRPVTGSVVDRLVLPLVDKAVPEWQATLDALLELPEIAGPSGYSGGVISIGVRLAVVEPRLSAAVLFAGSFVPQSIIDEARLVTIPLYVLLQWDDEGNDRRMALELFDAFGSAEKTLNANMGGHTGVPQHAGEEANRFLTRHLTSARARSDDS